MTSTFDSSPARVKELEKEVSELEIEMDRLKKLLTASKKNNKQLIEMNDIAEKELQKLIAEHHLCAQHLATK